MVSALAVIAGFSPGRTLCLCCFMRLAGKIAFLKDTGTIFLLRFNSIVSPFLMLCLYFINRVSFTWWTDFLFSSWSNFEDAAFLKPRFDSRNNNSSSLPETLKTILSLIIRSFSLKLHEAAREYNSVRNTPKGSWNGMFQNRKLWRTSFSRGFKYSSSFSRTFTGSFLS